MTLNDSILVLAAVAGIGAILYFSHYGELAATKKALLTKKLHFNVSRSFDDIEVPIKMKAVHIPKRKQVCNRIGWTVPLTAELEEPPFDRNLTRVSNDSFSIYDDTPADEGFENYDYAKEEKAHAFAGSLVPVSPYASPIDDFSVTPVNTTSPLADAAIASTDSIPSILVGHDTLRARVIDIENQILKMIIANTTSTNTILTNIDTIKQSIKTYRHKIRLVHEQLERGNVTPLQMQQFIMQVISDIATQLQLPLTPRFTAMLNSSPFTPLASPILSNSVVMPRGAIGVQPLLR